MMSLKRYTISTIFSLSVIVSFACGPFNALTDNPFMFHFYQEEEAQTIIDLQKKENILLWQSMTADTITPSDIESAVYEMSLSQLQYAFDRSDNTQNSFLLWIIRNQAKEIKDFLLLAKELEELRFNRVSPWYYPADKQERYDSRTECEKFADVIARCKKHSTGFLSDRYGLQYVRALMTLEKYDECIAFYNNVMSKLPDNNLFKRMAKGYVAGCYRRIGKNEKSNMMFAEIGDFNSIIDDKKVYFKTLVRNNPESSVIKSRLNHWIGYGDRSDNLIFLGIADAALSSPNVENRGDWLFLKAYIEETYNSNHIKALNLVRQAIKNSFSRGYMCSDAEIMELCLSAEQGNICKDLRYYRETFEIDSAPFYFYIVPSLLKLGKVSEAILLANYASYLDRAHEYHDDYSSFVNGSRNYFLISDDTYANTGFQLMVSRSAQDIVNYKSFLKSKSPIVEECKNLIRCDDDYLNEIIGTLYMREGNYDKAVEYLSQVSFEYQNDLNVFKCGYLKNNPWVNCYLPADKWEYPSQKGQSEESVISTFYPEDSSLLQSSDNAKLNFSKEMSRLQDLMKAGSPDERGMARIRYALARYNSFENCWALTQYWYGEANQCNYRPYYWKWDGKYKGVDYLKELTGQIPDKEWLDSEISKGIRELHSPEKIAEAEFLRGNYRTIAKRFPSTIAGRYLSVHCDLWNDWL